MRNIPYGLYVSYNSLTELIIDPKYNDVECNDNFLTELKCTDSLLELDCSHNGLTELELNDRLRACWCNYNRLMSIKCNKHLERLHCSYNNLTELELNDGLETLICDDNKLTSITYIPSTLKYISCFGNNFDFATKLRLIKWYFQDKKNKISYCFTTEIDDYKKYLVLLLQLNTYIIKYL